MNSFVFNKDNTKGAFHGNYWPTAFPAQPSSIKTENVTFLMNFDANKDFQDGGNPVSGYALDEVRPNALKQLLLITY